ncbi:hypothetical protein BO83DRAFT_250773 [Aspergillus eucalypticola CBS 122712]|uniref:Uncharacterized protein n=1 Tax=Aspergillus eucalypticola (strain CBS 122712 / IBT 29274) TaxID=1448314 RepID=A0A317VQX7_ASPEC|nr:uncharacterized protein BO83DRAFT_250773 [Aspergillus eucalypticola CBS 122712]PWY75959.1 hypothetical protein BO83DRAFT_250773 [Aspergillus eucalypticola CBS 122712]
MVGPEDQLSQLCYATPSFQGPTRSSVFGKDQEHISSKFYSMNQWAKMCRFATQTARMRVRCSSLCSFTFLRALSVSVCILPGLNCKITTKISLYYCVIEARSPSLATLPSSRNSLKPCLDGFHKRSHCQHMDSPLYRHRQIYLHHKNHVIVQAARLFQFIRMQVL